MGIFYLKFAPQFLRSALRACFFKNRPQVSPLCSGARPQRLVQLTALRGRGSGCELVPCQISLGFQRPRIPAVVPRRLSAWGLLLPFYREKLIFTILRKHFWGSGPPLDCKKFYTLPPWGACAPSARELDKLCGARPCQISLNFQCPRIPAAAPAGCQLGELLPQIA